MASTCLLTFILLFIASVDSFPAPLPETCRVCQHSWDCIPPDCVCCSDSMPMTRNKTPQIVYFTFDDAVAAQLIPYYKKLFPPHRLNPNGCPIAMTLFVSDKHTIYDQVKGFSDRGMEIGAHSVTHEHLTPESFAREALGQKQKLMQAGVPEHKIIGWRSPYLEVEGNTQFKNLSDLGFKYDATMTTGGLDDGGHTYPIPFTLDYGWPFPCRVNECPTEHHKGFWEVPVIELRMNPYQHCVYVDACPIPWGNKTAAFDLLWYNFQSYYEGNRAPFGLNMHAGWFYDSNRLNAMDEFIQRLTNMKDVYIVTVSQVIAWMRKPTSLTDLKNGRLKEWACGREKYFNHHAHVHSKPHEYHKSKSYQVPSNHPLPPKRDQKTPHHSLDWWKNHSWLFQRKGLEGNSEGRSNSASRQQKAVQNALSSVQLWTPQKVSGITGRHDINTGQMMWSRNSLGGKFATNINNTNIQTETLVRLTPHARMLRLINSSLSSKSLNTAGSWLGPRFISSTNQTILQQDQRRQKLMELQREQKLLQLQREQKEVKQLELQREKERQKQIEFQKKEREKILLQQREQEHQKQVQLQLEQQRLKHLAEVREQERLKQRELQREQQREQERLRQLEIQRQQQLKAQQENLKQIQLELEKLKREKEHKKQLQIEREKERQKQLKLKLEKERLKQEQIEREKERQKQLQLQLEKERQQRLLLEREKERQKLLQIEREKERQKQLELEKEREKQLQIQRERERQKQLELEREQELQKQLELEREQELQKQLQLEREKERQKQLQLEREKQRQKQLQQQREKQRQKQLQPESEKERQKQLQLEREKERQKQVQLEREKQRQKQLQLEREKERQKQLQLEREKERQRQVQLEREKQRQKQLQLEHEKERQLQIQREKEHQKQLKLQREKGHSEQLLLQQEMEQLKLQEQKQKQRQIEHQHKIQEQKQLEIQREQQRQREQAVQLKQQRAKQLEYQRKLLLQKVIMKQRRQQMQEQELELMQQQRLAAQSLADTKTQLSGATVTRQQSTLPAIPDVVPLEKSSATPVPQRSFVEILPEVSSGEKSSMPLLPLSMTEIPPEVSSGEKSSMPLLPINLAQIPPKISSVKTPSMPLLPLSLANIPPEVSSEKTPSMPLLPLSLANIPPEVSSEKTPSMPLLPLSLANIPPEVSSKRTPSMPLLPLSMAEIPPEVSSEKTPSMPLLPLSLANIPPEVSSEKTPSMPLLPLSVAEIPHEVPSYSSTSPLSFRDLSSVTNTDSTTSGNGGLGTGTWWKSIDISRLGDKIPAFWMSALRGLTTISPNPSSSKQPHEAMSPDELSTTHLLETTTFNRASSTQPMEVKSTNKLSGTQSHESTLFNTLPSTQALDKILSTEEIGTIPLHRVSSTQPAEVKYANKLSSTQSQESTLFDRISSTQPLQKTSKAKSSSTQQVGVIPFNKVTSSDLLEMTSDNKLSITQPMETSSDRLSSTQTTSGNNLSSRQPLKAASTDIVFSAVPLYTTTSDMLSSTQLPEATPLDKLSSTVETMFPSERSSIQATQVSAPDLFLDTLPKKGVLKSEGTSSMDKLQVSKKIKSLLSFIRKSSQSSLPTDKTSSTSKGVSSESPLHASPPSDLPESDAGTQIVSETEKVNTQKTVPVNQTTQHVETAPLGKCIQNVNCHLPYCSCKSLSNPKGIPNAETPQFVYIAMGGNLNAFMFPKLMSLFNPKRKNPNDCPISGTFFLSDQYSNYTMVKIIEEAGVEIGFSGLTSSMYRNVSLLEGDLEQQLKILDNHSIPSDTVSGWSSPGLQPHGDEQFTALGRKGFYDSSLLTEGVNSTQYWPFTMDFGWNETCIIEKCPTKAHPGVWEIPIIPFHWSKQNITCKYADTCTLDRMTVAETKNYLMDNFHRHYNKNRAPFGLRIHQTWFHDHFSNSLVGLQEFLDDILKLGDVYIVSITAILDWVEDPTPLSVLRRIPQWSC